MKKKVKKRKLNIFHLFHYDYFLSTILGYIYIKGRNRIFKCVKPMCIEYKFSFILCFTVMYNEIYVHRVRIWDRNEYSFLSTFSSNYCASALLSFKLLCLLYFNAYVKWLHEPSSSQVSIKKCCNEAHDIVNNFKSYWWS